MGNLYRLNSLFEWEISRPIEEITQNKTLLERSKLYEYLFLLLSREGDFTILSDSPSEEILEYWKKQNIEIGKIFLTDTPYFQDTLELSPKLSKDLQLVEWGKTSSLEKKLLIRKNPSKIELSLGRNSKINQTQWKDMVGKNSLTSIICSDKKEFDFCISQFPLPFVVKLEYGFSGVGNFVIKNQSDLENFIKNVDRIFNLNPKGIIVEEWVGENRTLDFSGIFQMHSVNYKLLAITKMYVDKKGVYRGTIIGKNFGTNLKIGLCDLVNRYLVDRYSYQGNMAMDGFVFTKDGIEKIQYMSEMNFRYSMGRVLFELHSKLGKEEENSALFFFTFKKKNFSFNSLVSNLELLEEKEKIKLLITTPPFNKSSKPNPFVGIYVRSENEINNDLVETLKSLFS